MRHTGCNAKGVPDCTETVNFAVLWENWQSEHSEWEDSGLDSE